VSVDPQHVRAIGATAELLTAVEAFESIGCNFGGATMAYIRAMRADPNRESFTFQGVTFEAHSYNRMVLILSHVAKPHVHNLDVQTLKPFADALVLHEVAHVRLVSPRAFTAWVEVQRGERWQKVQATPLPEVARV